MAFARDDTGIRADLDALASQVHPVFMLPPVAASAFGVVIAGLIAPASFLLHAAATFFSVYTAHV